MLSQYRTPRSIICYPSTAHRVAPYAIPVYPNTVHPIGKCSTIRGVRRVLERSIALVTGGGGGGGGGRGGEGGGGGGRLQ
eukprot:860186-Rhodomonas_salina.1